MPGAGGRSSVSAEHTTFRCYNCHGTTTTNTALPAIGDKARHVNGTVDLSSSLAWDADAKTCAAACHRGAVKAW